MQVMIRTLTLAAALVLATAIPAAAHGPAETVAKSPPAAPYQQVSKLVKLPDFLPGLGPLFVEPATLPAGPFLPYDHDAKLVSTTQPPEHRDGQECVRTGKTCR